MIKYYSDLRLFRIFIVGFLHLVLVSLSLIGCREVTISQSSDPVTVAPNPDLASPESPPISGFEATAGSQTPAKAITPPFETTTIPVPSTGTAEGESGITTIETSNSPPVEETNIVQLPLTLADSPAGDNNPPSTEVRPSSTPTPAPEATPTFDYPIYDGPALDRNDIGVQVHIHREDQDAIFDHLVALDVGWVKLQVSWKIYEPQPGQFDDFRIEELDRFITQATEKDIQVLLSVAKAPEWSRPTAELDGPPSDPSHFQAFMEKLTGRYQGQVAAYELWNEPNLQREWNGFPLDAADLVTLIQAGAKGAKAADPQVLLISGAPAPTGINDGISAIDDRQYLRSMITAGVADVVDGIGVHPYGWANPAESSWLDPEHFSPSHNNHPSFFFADTLRDYRQILDQNGLASLPLWSTEFGWGSYDGLDTTPPPGVEYMAHVNEWQQAAYTLKAYQLAHEWDVRGPLILWNLNFGPTFGSQFVESSYSLLRPDGARRPIYNSITTITKSD
jgi:hypothetical protein